MGLSSSNVTLLAGALVVLIALGAVGYFLLQRDEGTPVQSPTPAGTTPTETGIVPKGKVSWSIGTATAGSAGYLAHSTIAELMRREYPQFFEITVQPIGGAAAGHAAWDAGRVDLGYTALNIVYQYVTRTERWDVAVNPARKYDEMSVVLYQFPLIYTLFVTEDLAGRVRCWKDVAEVAKKGGEGLYATPTAFASHEVFRRVFSILLGVRATELGDRLNIQVYDVSRVADELALGRVKIIWGYGDYGGPVTWLAEALAKQNYRLVAVPPCADEIEKLKAAPDIIFLKMDLTPYNVRTADGKSVIEMTVATPFGLVGSSKALSKEHVYLFVKTHFTKCKELGDAIATFRNFCEWGIQFNIEAFKIQSMYGAKVHPGTALAFKELGYDLEKMGILVARD